MHYRNISFTNLILTINQDLSLRSLNRFDAKKLFELVDQNSAFLNEYLPWVAYNKNQHDTNQFVDYCLKCHQNQTELHLVILLKNQVTGVCSLTINQINNHADIGYWITEENAGKGIVTKAVQRLMKFGFEDLKLHKLIIKCAPENVPSNKIALKLNFKLEGLLEEHERHGNRYLSLNTYGFIHRKT